MILTGLARIGKRRAALHRQQRTRRQPLAGLQLRPQGRRRKTPHAVDRGIHVGKRAESLAPHLLKGQTGRRRAEEPHIETFEGRNGTGTKLVGRVLSIEFASDGQRQDAQQHETRAPARAGRRTLPARSSPAAARGGFGDFGDDDIPFLPAIGAGPPGEPRNDRPGIRIDWQRETPSICADDHRHPAEAASHRLGTLRLARPTCPPRPGRAVEFHAGLRLLDYHLSRLRRGQYPMTLPAAVGQQLPIKWSRREPATPSVHRRSLPVASTWTLDTLASITRACRWKQRHGRTRARWSRIIARATAPEQP